MGRRVAPQTFDQIVTLYEGGATTREIAEKLSLAVVTVDLEVRAHLQGGDWRKHGAASTYGKHGCRCEPCTQAWNAQNERYKAKKAAEAAGDVEGLVRAGYKPCAWPSCGEFVTVASTWCSTRRCVADRNSVRWGARAPTADEAAVLDLESERKAAALRQERRTQLDRRWKRLNPDKVRTWRRNRARVLGTVERLERQRVALSNHRYREALMERALENATEDLLAIVAEQKADGDRVKRAKGEWMMRSLDAPVLGYEEDVTLADLLSYGGSDPWADPTADAALFLIGLGERTQRHDLWRWNARDVVREPREHPKDDLIPGTGFVDIGKDYQKSA